MDLGVAGEVPGSEVLARRVDLLVSQSGQVGRGQGFGSAVAMTVENVSSENSFGSFGRSKNRETCKGN